VGRFEIGERDFLLEGKPFQVISGALHYFRVHPEQWRDRIRKAREMGLNTVETYVAWNAHSPRPGEFIDTDGLDLGRFLDLIADEGMFAIVRPGPYICAEWTNGGLPAWLFLDPETGIRRHEPTYLAAIRELYLNLEPILRPRQIDAGGPIILVQVENEYGAFGSDEAYLRELVSLTREIGVTVPLTTVDQPNDEMLRNGSLPELLRTASFGSRPAERMATLRQHQPTGPLMVSEFWDGWFDHWGEHHHTTSAAAAADDLDALLAMGASVNIYMFHGGTNFGLTNGANLKGRYAPITTSYDYDAPLDEAGLPTEKYWAFRDVIAKYAPVPPVSPAPPAEDRGAIPVRLERSVPLWAVLPELGDAQSHPSPPTADDIGHYAGFTVYETRLAVHPGATLQVPDVRDRAQVFLGERPLGVLNRDHGETMLPIPAGPASTLQLLVEDLGRVNYGDHIGEKKGIVGEVRLSGKPIHDWTVRPIDLERVDVIAAAAEGGDIVTRPLAGPAFAIGRFEISDASQDWHLDTDGWGKGVAWVNGFCLGRYWSRGPQRTLYVPAPVLNAGINTLLILELHAADPDARLVDRADLGPLES
jgi:beta-galactosidase